MCAANSPKIKDVTMPRSSSTSLNLKFNSFKEFQDWKEHYQNENYVQLATIESRKLPAGHSLAEQIVYKTIIFGCKYGKKVHPSSATKICVSSYKQGCPFRMVVKCKGEKLQIIRLHEVHNGHPINEKAFKHLPEQRRLSRQEKLEAEILLSCKASKKQVQSFLMQKTNKVVLMKDIHNIASKIKLSPGNTHNVQELILELKGIPRTVTQVMEDEQGEPIGIFFQDQRMSKLFDAFSDLIIYDVTFNITSCQMDVILLFIVDGNGESEICCMWFIKSDRVETVSYLAEVFRSQNPKWESIEVFFTEKDLAYRDLLKEKFPQALIENSPFHILKLFGADLSFKKYGISESDRQTVLKIFEDMVWANSENHYKKLYEQLCSLRLPNVMSYFDSNWHNNAHEWVACARNRCVNYMNRITNKVENLSCKLQSVVSKYNQLQPFFIDLMANKFTGSVDSDHRDMMVFQKVPVSNCKRDHWDLEELISGYLTPFASEKVLKQFDAHDVVEFESTPDIFGVGKVINTTGRVVETTSLSCTCEFWTKMTLPCRHMFAFRHKLNEPLFLNELCHKRWTRDYMQTSLFETDDATSQKTFEPGQILYQTGDRNISKGSNHLLELAWKMASSQPQDLNDHYTEQLRKFIDLMNDGKRIRVEDESYCLSESREDIVLRPARKAGRKRKRAPSPLESQIELTEEQDLDAQAFSYTIIIPAELEKVETVVESTIEIVKESEDDPSI